VHAFLLSVIERRLGHSLPPHELKPQGPASLADALRQWLDVLDLATTPAMMRDALEHTPAREPLEALLRMYIVRASLLEAERDKTDFLVTYLYRNPPRWRDKGRPKLEAADAADYATDYEGEILAILGDEVPVDPTPAQRGLVVELLAIRHEVEAFASFDQLTDSHAAERMRGLKQRLGAAFYHPSVLARVASYNAFFGKRFDELFRRAAGEIRTRAAVVDDRGTRELAGLETERVLRQDFAAAQQHFRKVAECTKALRATAGL
jgi:hypothetical protein